MVIFRAGEVTMSGQGVGILPHIKTALQTRARWRKRERESMFNPDTVSHLNHQEVKCKTDLVSHLLPLPLSGARGRQAALNYVHLSPSLRSPALHRTRLDSITSLILPPLYLSLPQFRSRCLHRCCFGFSCPDAVPCLVSCLFIY